MGGIVPGILSLENVIQIFTHLESNYLQLPISITGARPRNADALAKFLGGYSRQTYEIREIDFYDTTDLDAVLVKLRPEQRDVYSFCQIFGRKNPEANSLEKVQRMVRIFINDHATGAGSKLVNECWNRFCQVKEICQAILFEELNLQNPDLYPETGDYSKIVELLSDINNKPFSLSDFGNVAYPDTLAVENAAELLAALLLIPIEDLQTYRNQILAQFGPTGLKSYNYYDIAYSYKAPRRYVEVLTTWDSLDNFVSKINVARDGYLKA